MPTADRRVTVVLADDDIEIRAALRDLFASTDVEVVAEASTAAEAVDACARLAPHVALLDVRMPGGGLDAARAITASSDTAVVVLTAHDTPEHRETAAANGAARFVVKSNGDDLLRTVLEVADH